MNSINNLLNIIFIVLIVTIVSIVMYQNHKSKNNPSKGVDQDKNNKASNNAKKESDYQTDFVDDFLSFDKISNDMIIREKGTKYTMVIHCSGTNYDLMSENEKGMVEEAFIELLNFIQFPIQIYVQTRKVDLKDSLKLYEQKINNIDNQIRSLVDEYNLVKSHKTASLEQLDILEYEIERKQNLFEYAQDLKKAIERMSMNKNVLQQKYYIVITYHVEELGLMTNFSDSEIESMARSELLTRCHSIAGALAGCSVEADILDSNGLAELLYMAINRDDAELYRLKDSMEAGFYRLYSTTESAAILQQNELDEMKDSFDNQLQFINGQLDLSKVSKLINEV